MAEKMIFWPSDSNFYMEELIDYTYYPGFAISQKQKSINSLHAEIVNKHPHSKPLEISTKSTEPIGVKLSAFNLEFFHQGIKEYRSLENVFQSSKVFENGGPYRHLLNVAPKDAKKYDKLHTSGELIAFNLYGHEWALEPKTMFYDWIYINALISHEGLIEELAEWTVFTDIEFNHKKSINCQARSAAIAISLYKQGKLIQYLNDTELFRTIYIRESTESPIQMSIFDL